MGRQRRPKHRGVSRTRQAEREGKENDQNRIDPQERKSWRSGMCKGPRVRRSGLQTNRKVRRRRRVTEASKFQGTRSYVRERARAGSKRHDQKKSEGRNPGKNAKWRLHIKERNVSDGERQTEDFELSHLKTQRNSYAG